MVTVKIAIRVIGSNEQGFISFEKLQDHETNVNEHLTDITFRNLLKL